MLTAEERRRVVETLDAFCDARVPIMVRDKVVLQFRIHRHDVVLFEKRPVFDDPSRWIELDVAKFRLNRPAETWSLLWRGRNSKWHHYKECEPSPDLAALLREVDQDPTGIFWG